MSIIRYANYSLNLTRTNGEAMLAKIKNAAALHTPSHLQIFNRRLPEFGPVYCPQQSRTFASGPSDYIDILIATEMDETVIDASGSIICQLPLV